MCRAHVEDIMSDSKGDTAGRARIAELNDPCGQYSLDSRHTFDNVYEQMPSGRPPMKVGDNKKAAIRLNP